MPAEADRGVTAAVACPSRHVSWPDQDGWMDVWIDGWSVVLRSTRHNTGHFGDVLLSQSLGRGTGTEKILNPTKN